MWVFCQSRPAGRIAHRRRPAADDVGIPHCRTCRLRVMAASAAAVALPGVAVALIDSEMSIPLVLATVVIRWPISVVAQHRRGHGAHRILRSMCFRSLVMGEFARTDVYGWPFQAI